MIILRVDEFKSKIIVDNRNNNLKHYKSNYKDIYLKKNINNQLKSINHSFNTRTQETRKRDKIQKSKKSENYIGGKSIEIRINKNNSYNKRNNSSVKKPIKPDKKRSPSKNEVGKGNKKNFIESNNLPKKKNNNNEYENLLKQIPNIKNNNIYQKNKLNEEFLKKEDDYINFQNKNKELKEENEILKDLLANKENEMKNKYENLPILYTYFSIKIFNN